MTEKQGSWHLLTGAILGLLLGILLSLWVIPVRYVNVDPSRLSKAAREDYRIMIAQAYLVEGDVYRALSRLELLKDANPSELIIAQAQNMLAEGGSEAQARALALLAAAVNEPSLSITPLPPMTPVAAQATEPSVAVTEPPPSGTTTTGTDIPGVTSTARPATTPMSTPAALYVLEDPPMTKCDSQSEKSLLQVTVLDADAQPVPGVKIEISQSVGNPETFYTGLYPEISRGYADYEMLPGTLYTLRVGETGQPVPNLTAPPCNDSSGGTTYGNLWLVFIQPYQEKATHPIF